MLDVIKFLNLGQWAVGLAAAVGLWHWVLKGLVEKWFQNRLELQKLEIGSALQAQKDLAVREAEFERVKLERALPLLEEINTVITEYQMMFSTHISLINNKGGFPENFEERRFELDKEIIPALSSIAIYLPHEMRALLYQIRKIISCSWKDPLKTYYLLLEHGGIECVSKVCKQSYDEYVNFLNCFHDICNLYLGVSRGQDTYSEILKRYNFSEDIELLNASLEQDFIWSYLLFHEYGRREKVSIALSNIKSHYKPENGELTNAV